MDIYGIAWKNLERKIAATRRRAISKADLTKWQLEALEEAVDGAENPSEDRPIPGLSSCTHPEHDAG